MTGPCATNQNILEDIMSNPLAVAFAAVVAHIQKHAAIPEEVLTAEKEMRAELDKLNKKQLIDRLVNLQLKKSVKVVQGDLVADILCDPVCAILTYEEISETILENLDTDQKYSVDNLRWYKSNLQNVKGLPVLNRMSANERKVIDRQMVKAALKK